MFRYDEKKVVELLILVLTVIIAFLIGVRAAYPPLSLTDSLYSFLYYLFMPVQQISQLLQQMGFQKAVADIIATPLLWLITVMIFLYPVIYGKKKGKVTKVEAYRGW